MASVSVVLPSDLGNSFDFGNIEASKIHVNVDGASLVRDPATGQLSVDLAGVVIKSADAGNILNLGTDGGLLLTNEEVQDAIGQAIVSATDGLDYDDVANAISASVAALAAVDSDSIDMGITSAGGTSSITADLIVDPAADNQLSVSATGAFVAATVIPPTLNTHSIDSGNTFTTHVDGVAASTTIVELQDAFGNHLGEILA